MSEIDYHYAPEEWCLVQITNNDPHYRVFGSWRGGYITGDSWKLNSGITSVEEDEEFYYFKGYSGSVYRCHKERYGIRSPYNSGILATLPEHMSMMQEMPDVMNMDWII